MPERNKLYESDVIILHAVPLIGLLSLQCEHGPIEIAINRVAAETLRKALGRFLVKAD